MQSKRKGRLTAITYTTILLVTGIGAAALGFSRVAAAAVPPTVLFTTTDNAIWGWMVKTTADSQQQSATITPLAPTAINSSGFDEANLDNAVRSIFGVEVYNFANVTDLTVNFPSGIQDSGQTTTNTSDGSLFGGLITWKQNSVTVLCSVDAHIPLLINCQINNYTEGLTINGVAVASGIYPQGTSFPVAGPINDSQCSSGSETFSGTLTPRELNVLGDETTRPTIVLTSLHLVGDATCSTPGTGTLFTTHYDLTVGNHTLAQHEKSGVGDLNIAFTGGEYFIYP